MNALHKNGNPEKSHHEQSIQKMPTTRWAKSRGDALKAPPLGILSGAGDGIRTRDSLLGRQELFR